MPALKTGYDSTGSNRLQPADPVVFLRLQFKDPEGNSVDFPAGWPLIVEFDADNNKRFTTTTGANGSVRFTISQALSAATWDNVTLYWDNTDLYYAVYTSDTPPAPTEITTDLDRAQKGPPGSPPPSPPRFFSLPKKFALKQVDLNADPVLPAHAVWTAATKSIGQTNKLLPQDIGSEGAPIAIVIKPVWTFLRFEFFDRYYGEAPRSNAAGANHGGKVTIPPIALEGFRSNADPAAVDTADTVSNWSVADATNKVQCLPWFLKRALNDADLPALTGATMSLRATQPADTYIHSTALNTREIKVVTPAPKPGPKRLQYYKLPTLWKSKNYYTRNVTGGPPNAKFFGELTEGDITAANSTANALKFWLDDLVLTYFTPGGQMNPVPLDAAHRVTLFHHRFKNLGATYTNHGVYQKGADVTAEGYPYTDTTIPPANRYGNVGGATAKYYLTDYPDWTRAVMAQGNLFDALDERTTADCPVVGARAAVRWVDATVAPNGTRPSATGNPAASPPGHNGAINPRPGIVVKPANDDTAAFAMQGFYSQYYLTRYHSGNPQAGPLNHNEWTTAGVARDEIGRIDLALLRCSDYDGNDEISVLLRYNRFFFDFASPDEDNSPPNFNNPMTASPPSVAQMDWVKQFVDNSSDRWNGCDTYNTDPSYIVPRPASPPAPAVRVHIVSVFQFLKWEWAHFYVKTIAPSGRSGMGGYGGSGTLRVNCTVHDDGSVPNDAWGSPTSGRGMAAAHELGHCGSLPDDYINNDAASKNTKQLNLLGAPYVMEAEDFVFPNPPSGKGLMHGNWWMRSRYLWHAAEWLRLLDVYRAVDFKIEHYNANAPGANPENNYFLPHYPRGSGAGTARRLRHFVNWPLRVNLYQNLAPNRNIDTALWMLGEDKYSTVVLPNKMLGVAASPPPGRIDGILTILVRYRVKLDFPANADRKKAIRDYFYKEIIRLVESRLNFKRCAAFQPCGVGANRPSFSRCLLHFMPCFTTEGLTAAADNTDAAILTDNESHLRIVLGETLSPPGDTWAVLGAQTEYKFDGPAGFATLGNLAAWLNYWAGVVYEKTIWLLGLTPPGSPPDQFDRNSFVPLVRTVMEAGGPDPQIL